MPRPFGRLPFGKFPYSADLPFGGISVVAGSSVSVTPRVTVSGVVSIQGSSAVAAYGRLLWDHILVPPCEIWPELPALPPFWAAVDEGAPGRWPELPALPPFWAPVEVAACGEWPPIKAEVVCR